MNRHQRLLNRILDGRNLANIRFADVRALLVRMGFEERIRGSHHSYRMAGVVDKVNLQPIGSDAKPYQLRELRKTLLNHDLRKV
ncbi:MAG: type II toxin-antitoxin system HicA family toxin [Chloroflexi bacterium]|nr:type II toxin-antitoxin system HicA family toxin [Chloroflexota bacterium]MYJ58459.1 type II toxin-antitoxin system HicA family toxin [Chloroflexota bacterium]